MNNTCQPSKYPSKKKKNVSHHRHIKYIRTIHKRMNRTNRKLQYNNYCYFEVQGCVKNYFTHQFLPIDFRGEGSPVLRHSYRFTRSNEAAKKLLLLVSPSAQVTPLCSFA